MWAESQTVCTFPAGDNSLKDIHFKVSPMHINDKKITAWLCRAQCCFIDLISTNNVQAVATAVPVADLVTRYVECRSL